MCSFICHSLIHSSCSSFFFSLISFLQIFHRKCTAAFPLSAGFWRDKHLTLNFIDSRLASIEKNIKIERQFVTYILMFLHFPLTVPYFGYDVVYCWNYCCENVCYVSHYATGDSAHCFFFYLHFIHDPLCFFHAGHDLNIGLYGIETWPDVVSSLFQWNCQLHLAFPETCRSCLRFHRIFLCASSNSLSPLHWQECNLHNNTIKHSVTAILSAAAKWPLKNTDCNGNAVSVQCDTTLCTLFLAQTCQSKNSHKTWRHDGPLPPCYHANRVFACVRVQLMRVCVCAQVWRSSSP